MESEFRFSEETGQLLPSAEKKVKATLVSHFGSPQNPQIDFYFPLERGGTVIEIDAFDPEKPTEITIAAEEEVQIAPGDRLEFLFDPEDKLDVMLEAAEDEQPNPFENWQTPTVAAFDASSGLVTLNHPLPDIELIEPGLEVSVNANSDLAAGQKLYEKHCQHCHGVSGDGNGPTATYMNPKPRDYRKGVFKFKSTGARDRISTSDLKQILQDGIPGTYMPSFNTLSDEELDLLVTYVKFLSMRGEAEQAINIETGLDFSKSVLDEELEGVDDAAEAKEIKEDFEKDLEEFLAFDYPEIELGAFLDLADSWEAADDEEAVVLSSVPRTDPDGPSAANPDLSSLENGKQLYLGKDAQCASCHGDAGHGDGYQTKQLQKRRDGSTFDVVGLHDEWENPLKPRDLTADIYRGGRRPIDVFRRIHAGISGTPMPAFGQKTLSDEQIWDIVNYVMSMPYED